MRSFTMLSGWLLATVLYGMTWIFPHPEEIPRPVPASPSAAVASAEPTNENNDDHTAHQNRDDAERQRLQRDKNRLTLRAAELEGRIAALETAAAEREDELRRYRSGLERAVAELNRLASSRSRRSRPASHASRHQAQSSPPGMRSKKQAASIQVVGDQIFVSGELRNPRREATDGVLWIELLKDDQRIDSVRRLVEIPAGGRVPFDHRFRIAGGGAGTYSARAVLEY